MSLDHVETKKNILFWALGSMAIQVVEFSSGGTILEIFLHKNQQNKRKSFYFDFWINGELSKMGHHFINKVI